jgi:hypothetical protein
VARLRGKDIAFGASVEASGQVYGILDAYEIVDEMSTDEMAIGDIRCRRTVRSAEAVAGKSHSAVISPGSFRSYVVI